MQKSRADNELGPYSVGLSLLVLGATTYLAFNPLAEIAPALPLFRALCVLAIVVSLTTLQATIERLGGRSRASVITLAALTLTLCSTPWTVTAVETYYPSLPPYLAVAAALGLVLGSTLLACIPFYLSNAIRRYYAFPVAVTVGWTAFELLPRPLPWSVTSPLIDVPLVPTIAAWFGTPGITFFCFAIGATLTQFTLKPSEIGVQRTLVNLMALGGVASALCVGSLSMLSKNPEDLFSVGLVQGNDPPAHTLDASMGAAGARRYEELSKNLRPPPDLFIWPESAVNTALLDRNRDPSGVAGASFFTEPLARPTIFGSATHGLDPILGTSGFLISAMLRSTDGRITQFYHKRASLPFAEDIPFRRHIRGLAALWSERGFIPGSEPSIVAVSRGRGFRGIENREPLKLAVQLCYEETLPASFLELIQLHEVDALVVLANGAWFGDSRGIYFQSMLGRWRAAELGRAIIRSTTTGVSGVWLPDGSQLAVLPVRQAIAVTVKDIPIFRHPTPYSIWGNWALWSLLLISMLLCRRKQE